MFIAVIVKRATSFIKKNIAALIFGSVHEVSLLLYSTTCQAMTNSPQISPLNRSDKARPYSRVFEGDCKLELRHNVIRTKRFSNEAIIEKTMLNAMFVNITLEFADSWRTPRQINSLEMFSPRMSSLFFSGFVKFNETKFVVSKRSRFVNPDSVAI